jgi:hypothetical protein
MKSELSDFLRSYGLDQGEGQWNNLEKAVRSCSCQSEESRGVTHRLLFTLLRSAFMGDERDHLGFFRDPGDGSVAVYWANNCGPAHLNRFDRLDPGAIQDFLSGHLADLEWGPLQFYGCDIINEAPDLLPKTFFIRLLQEAYDRYPDDDRVDEGEDWSNPADWVEEHYDEYGHA